MEKIFIDYKRYNKEYWVYTAILIEKMGYEKWKYYIPELMIWLQDINWPGSYIIYNMFLNVDKEIILPYINSVQEEAKKYNDNEWYEILEELKLGKAIWDINEIKKAYSLD
ncbi:hypothetical protein D3C72_1910980 [compost metagenome]